MQIVTASRTLVASVAFLILCSFAFSHDPHDCSRVPDYNKLKAALTSAVKEGKGRMADLETRNGAP